MSSVRMCDMRRSVNCVNIFSENAEGWTTFTGARQRRDRDGKRFTEQMQQDACPACSGYLDAPQPGEPDYKRIAELETNLGVGEK